MNTKMQSALAKTPLRTREAKKSEGPESSADVSELLMVELTARRARLREILRLIQMEAARETQNPTGPAPRRGCRRTPAAGRLTPAAMRAGGAG